jgi:opacity protein-like surface antigen
MRKQALIAVAGLFLLTSIGRCQENRFDASLNATYAFSKQSSGNGTILNPTQATGVLGSFRLRFNPKSAFELNYDRTNNFQQYTAGPFVYRVQSNITEFSGAYVFSPLQEHKFEPFLLGGVGALVFSPSSTFVNSSLTGIGALRQTRVAFLYGVGVDYPVPGLGKHLAVRVQYRGLVYQAPDFKVQKLFIGSYGHMAEPSAGVVFRF